MSEDTTRNLPGGDLGEVLLILRSMNTRLTALEDKVERRLQDSRPIWEQVLERLTAVEERLTKVEERLGKIEEEVADLGLKFRVFNADFLKLQKKHDNLEERLKQMESEHT